MVKRKYQEEEEFDFENFINEDDFIVFYSEKLLEIVAQAQTVNLSDADAVANVLSQMEEVEHLIFDVKNFGYGGVPYQSLTLGYYIKLLSEVGRFDKAIKLSDVATQNMEMAIHQNVPQARNHIGNIYFAQKKFEEAITHYDKGLHRYEEGWAQDAEVVNLAVYKGLALFYLGDYTQAKEWFLVAEKYNTPQENPMDDFSNTIWSYFFLKTMCKAENDFKTAEKYEKKFLELLKNKNTTEIHWAIRHFHIPKEYSNEILVYVKNMS